MENPESLVNRVTLLEEGFHNMIGAEQDLIDKMKRKSGNINEFANYILNPVLTDIDIQFKGIDVFDVSPSSQPDLFASRPVVVYGKFKGKAKGSITISGSTAGVVA